MCGIAGYIRTKGISSRQDCERMVKVLRHRGPDDHGVWVNEYSGVALGHARLSILDISPKGHQPMHSASGRYVIVFNGEIYNFKELRSELGKKDFKFNGHSDTEVLLAAVENWGLLAALEKFVGMFAFAVWDHEQQILHLARDRMGEKPLYYGESGGFFLFGSELKALKMHPAFNMNINRDALTLMLRHNYIPAPYTIYQNIYKLYPGTVLSVDCRSSQITKSMKTYWSVCQTAEEGNVLKTGLSDEEAVETLDNILRKTIRQQMVADVPLGAFLSGGYDSSTVVALMQAQSDRPVRTFSIGFHEDGYNEAQYAKTVAEYLGTDHTELYITSRQALDVISRLPELYDEPFSDSSQIPTFLISELTRRHVTVSLSGDGGDELFGGYDRYLLAQNIWNKMNRSPDLIYRFVSGAITSISPASWNKIFNSLQPFLPNCLRYQNAGDKLYKLIDIIKRRSPEDLYRTLVSHWLTPEDLVVDGREPLTFLTRTEEWPVLSSYVEWMMYMDSISYMPDDILVKIDRAAMGISLETRVPFLDHRVVEFAWRVPLSMKIRDGKGKWILRQVLNKYVPKELTERPKMGFGVPIDSWLRGPLREWAEELLDEKRLQVEGFFRPAQIRQKWAEHISGRRNWQYHLWDILMFQAWFEVWGSSE